MSLENSVALIHGYYNDQRIGRENWPDIFSRSGILAACELLRRGLIKKICITAIPKISGPMESRVRWLLPKTLDEDNLIVYPVAASTKEELISFKKLAQKNGWLELISIANRVHIPRIKTYLDENSQINTVSATEILARFHPRYEELIINLDQSNAQKTIKEMDDFYMKFKNIPFVYTTLVDFLTKHFPEQKIALQVMVGKYLERRRK